MPVVGGGPTRTLRYTAASVVVLNTCGRDLPASPCRSQRQCEGTMRANRKGSLQTREVHSFSERRQRGGRNGSKTDKCRVTSHHAKIFMT